MRGSVSKYVPKLKPKHRQQLEAIVRRRSPSHWMVSRARIVLMSSSGLGIEQVGRALSLDRQVVRRWLKRFCEGGMAGLRDRERSGRPTRIKAVVWQKAATLVVQPPTKFGVPGTRWSIRDLETYLMTRGLAVSRSSLSRFFRSIALKPHRVRYWLNPSDPDFDEKAARICRLYVEPPPKTVVLSLDEKPGVQALPRRHPTRLPRPGTVAKVEFEYRRNGTRNIFAAFNVKTGHVLLDVTEDRATPSIIACLDRIVQRYRRGPIVIITDNIHTRRGKPARHWLRRHPRVSFVFTPFHGSWLNQVESWFGILTSKALRGRSFSSTDELVLAINAFTAYWNNELARPFAWTYTGKVLAA